MKVIRRATIIVTLLLLPISAEAWEEPDDFRGIPFGASAAEVETLLRNGKVADIPNKGLAAAWAVPTCISAACLQKNTIGPVVVDLQYQFVDGKFAKAAVIFKAPDFDQMRAIFISRYGTPTEIKEETIQNRMGATFQNQRLRWDGERVAIRLERYFGKITEGWAIIGLKESFAQDREKAVEAIKRGKDDL